jgi:hypothetical protein
MSSTAPFVTAILAAATLLLAGCATYTLGSKNDSTQNGSYSGYTLNSPVTDQDAHVGGLSSYPTASDQGVVPPPPQKVDGR